MSSIDWAQSSMNNFSPLITREFEQDSNATIVAVADASLSTRCGVHGVPIAAAIARSVAAVGLSAMFFQDLFGLITFDDQFQQLASARPRIGRSHVLYCLDLYQNAGRSSPVEERRDIIVTIESQLRKASLVPVISDFLFPDADRLIRELSLLNAVHDVFLLMADVALCLRAARRCRPAGSRRTTWRPATRACSRGGSCGGSPARVEAWQDRIESAGARRRSRRRPRRPRPLADGNDARGVHRRTAAAEDVAFRTKSQRPKPRSNDADTTIPASRSVVAGLLARSAGATHRRSARRAPVRSSRIRSAAGGRPIAARFASASGSR